MIKNYCQQRHYQLFDQYRLVETASKDHRQQFKKILKKIMAEKDKVAIIISRTDRLTRQDCNDLDELRKADKIEIHLIDRYSVLTAQSTPDDLANWEIGVTYAKRESRMISQRVNENRLHQMENGQYLRIAPVGYLNSIKENGDKTVIVDPDKGHLVKKVFLEFAKGSYTEKNYIRLRKKDRSDQLKRKRYYSGLYGGITK